MSEDRVCQGYKVIKSERVGLVEIVLAHNSKAPSPYGTWKAYAHSNFQDFAYGNYFGSLERAEADFERRTAELRESVRPPVPRHKPDSHDKGGGR